jgi:hypothetical protein
MLAGMDAGLRDEVVAVAAWWPQLAPASFEPRMLRAHREFAEGRRRGR